MQKKKMMPFKFSLKSGIFSFNLQSLHFLFFHSGNTEHLLLHVLYLYLSIFIQLVYHEQLVLRCILFQHSAGLTTALSPFGIRDSKIRAYLSSLQRRYSVFKYSYKVDQKPHLKPNDIFTVSFNPNTEVLLLQIISMVQLLKPVIRGLLQVWLDPKMSIFAFSCLHHHCQKRRM